MEATVKDTERQDRVIRLLEAAISEARLIKPERNSDKAFVDMLINRIFITLKDYKERIKETNNGPPNNGA
jgi:hypothetical protein